jgi:MFS family permease
MKHHEILGSKGRIDRPEEVDGMLVLATLLAPLVPPTTVSGVPDLHVSPSSSTLPGGDQLQALINGLALWALIAALAGMLVGAVLWAVGHHSSNYQQAYSGRKGVMVSGAAAMIIGAAPALINYFFSLGQAVNK